MTPSDTGRSLDPATVTLDRPVLSICVTTYNRAAWLRHSLGLILEQTRPYPDLVEVVVCDNASSDATPEVCQAFQQWPNLRVHRNAANVGMLGNLAVSANQARGRYVWVIGDDDLMVEGALERILAAIAFHPDVELVYTNYAYTSFNRPQDLANATGVIRAAAMMSPQVRDEYTTSIRTISGKSNNCFTAIYCLIFREDHARAAYGQDTSGPPFSSLATCVPSTQHVLEHMFNRPGYWVGDPCVVVNWNVSWSRFVGPYLLERFPEIFDRMEALGADRREIDGLRTSHLPHVARILPELYFGNQMEHLPSFSIERLVRRFGRLEAFDRYWPAIRAVYARAFEAKRVRDPSLTPDALDTIRREAAGSPAPVGS